MSADSFHHRVELSMKQRGKIYDFNDYEQCVRNSRSGRVDVKSMTVSDFRDWVDESSAYKIAKSTPRPYLAEMVWIRFQRGKVTFDYKTEFGQTDVTTCNFLTAKACKNGVAT